MPRYLVQRTFADGLQFPTDSVIVRVTVLDPYFYGID